MIKIIFLLKRKPGMSVEAFREHYEKHHSELARKYIGHLLLSYTRNYVDVAGGHQPDAITGVSSGGEPDYDVVTEMVLENEAALAEMERINNLPELAPIFAADEARFLDREALRFFVCKTTASDAPAAARAAATINS